MALVNSKRLAQLLNVSQEWVFKLVRQGMPQHSRGRYEDAECIIWHNRFLQGALRKKGVQRGDGTYGNMSAERLRLLRAEAELKEYALAKERREFASVEDFERLMTAMIVTTKARILAIPPRVAPQLAGEDRLAIESRLVEELKDSLKTLAKNGFCKARTNSNNGGKHG